MKQRDFNCRISANVSPSEAFDKISRVPEWWVTNIEGKTKILHDIFIYHHGQASVTFKIIEVVPDKKIVWLVTDCNIPYLKNIKEWNDTKAIWDISNKDSLTQIDFTHLGLVPDLECYQACERGWSLYIKESFFKFLTTGKGLPDKW